MRIDSHVHFWRYNEAEFGWVGHDHLRRDFMPDDYAPLLAADELDGIVAVQARSCLEENDFLLKLADENPWILGVVGWVDLCSPDAESQLRHYASHPKFKGVRHIVQGEPDPEFLLRKDFDRGVALLADYRLTYDLLVYAHQLPVAAQFVDWHPALPIVLDHCGKPPLKSEQLENWLKDSLLSACYTVKVSGLVTEAGPFDDALQHGFRRAVWDPQTGHFVPPEYGSAYGNIVKTVERIRRVYRENVLIGSDWPVCLGELPDGSALRLYDYLVGDVDHGTNAAEFYRLGPIPPRASDT